MFIFIGEKNCPTCGALGSAWKKDPKVYICPHCNSFFNEFGIILEPQIGTIDEIGEVPELDK